MKSKQEREFENTSIPPEDLKKILDAGMHAPSGYNLQTTTFYAVTDGEIRKKLA
ncbi:nitroreductase family protein [Lachnoanaerobaculum saburreum]|uniref:nitroreductase family protein n=1 Tax=Lachnoanaerobaculum saburreum TaxID=467210 RepID=UPI0024183087|nr:nitroreductase family protein [Lachnoanaerobaculum saburreum]